MINSITDLMVFFAGFLAGGVSSVAYFSYTQSKINWKR